MGTQGSAVQEPNRQSLCRQGSFYNLTLDEVQHELGGLRKPLGSMNLDELLESVWTVKNNGGGGGDCGVALMPPSLQRQGSLTLSKDVSKKTVDEVWRDIQQKKKNIDRDGGDRERADQVRHPTLGEITLEDLLIEAGVVTTDLSLAMAVSQQQSNQWMQFQVTSMQQPQPPPTHQQKMIAVFVPGQQPLPVLDLAYGDAQITMSSLGTLSDTPMQGRKRVAPGDEVEEKTVERRQKRMIKNRESAARSRARRQAYTHELERKVSRLEEENERLRRKKEVENSKILPHVLPPEPKRQLSRTSSAPF